MNDAIESILAKKVKSCFSVKRLPNSFADNIIASYKRRVRNFRLKMCGIICILTIALGWAAIPSRHIKDMPHKNEAELVSASESKSSQEITSLMILGFLRDCVFTRRNNKKREDSSNDN